MVRTNGTGLAGKPLSNKTSRAGRTPVCVRLSPSSSCPNFVCGGPAHGGQSSLTQLMRMETGTVSFYKAAVAMETIFCQCHIGLHHLRACAASPGNSRAIPPGRVPPPEGHELDNCTCLGFSQFPSGPFLVVFPGKMPVLWPPPSEQPVA